MFHTCGHLQIWFIFIIEHVLYMYSRCRITFCFFAYAFLVVFVVCYLVNNSNSAIVSIILYYVTLNWVNYVLDALFFLISPWFFFLQRFSSLLLYTLEVNFSINWLWMWNAWSQGLMFCSTCRLILLWVFFQS